VYESCAGVSPDAASAVIWMLAIHAKNEVEAIAPHVLRKIKDEIDE
jgi:hypothetical protein